MINAWISLCVQKNFCPIVRIVNITFFLNTWFVEHHCFHLLPKAWRILRPLKLLQFSASDMFTEEVCSVNQSKAQWADGYSHNLDTIQSSNWPSFSRPNGPFVMRAHKSYLWTQRKIFYFCRKLAIQINLFETGIF